MNRKRLPDESFDEYRKSLKEEEANFKRNRWRQIWTSAIIVPDANDKDSLPLLRKLVKLRVRGAFVRKWGHRMPNSDFEKNKRDRTYRLLVKKGVIKDEE